MEMTGSSPVMTGLDRCMQYVTSKGGWYYMVWHETRRHDTAHSWLREVAVAELGRFRSAGRVPRALDSPYASAR
jgi:hypothetical protein